MIHGNSVPISPRDLPVSQYQLKQTVYTKEEVDTLLEEKMQMVFVDELPASGEPNVIYCLLSDKQESGNLYDEYIWRNDQWEQVGSDVKLIDLENYYTKTEIDNNIYTKTQSDNNYYKKNQVYTKTEVDAKVQQVTAQQYSKLTPTNNVMYCITDD
jgi:hypothetical protein